MTYYENREAKEIGWASFFIGLAACSRNDGLVLFPFFVLISLFFLRSTKIKWKTLLFNNPAILRARRRVSSSLSPRGRQFHVWNR